MENCLPAEVQRTKEGKLKINIIEMEFIETSNAPIPAGHYSQAVIAGNLIFISGQLPINPATKEKTIGTIEEQTLQVLKNIKAIIEEAGGNLHDIIKTTVYISDISLWDSVNRVYASFFGNHKPARAVVPTRDLHFGFKIEIEAIGISSQQPTANS